jgi:hypothetical protein
VEGHNARSSQAKRGDDRGKDLPVPMRGDACRVPPKQLECAAIPQRLFCQWLVSDQK